MYGQTEASPRISYIDISENIQKQLDSIGRSIKGGKLFLNLKKKKLLIKDLKNYFIKVKM